MTVGRRAGRVVGWAACGLVVAGCASRESTHLAVGQAGGDPPRLEVVLAGCGAGDADDASGDAPETAAIVGIEVRAPSDPATTTTIDLPGTGELPVLATKRYDRIIWAVRSDQLTPIDSVVVGTTPAGFTETVPLAEPLPDRLLVRAWTTDEPEDGLLAEGVDTLEAVVADVPADGTLVLGSDGVSSRTEFEASVVELCADSVLDDIDIDLPGIPVTRILLVALLVGATSVGLLAAVLRRTSERFENEFADDLDDDPDADVDGGDPP